MTQAAYRKYCPTPVLRAPRTLRVSDHAVVRWLERVLNVDTAPFRAYLPKRPSQAAADRHLMTWMARYHGFDVEAVRARIMKSCADAAMFGASRVKTPDCDFIIMNGCVVTVLI